MPILTEEMVKKAVELVRPSAEAILNAEGTTWGPKWVEGLIRAPGLYSDVYFGFGDSTYWNPEWGYQRDFLGIAKYKLGLAGGQQMATSTVVATRPWVIGRREYLYAGGVYEDGISVAVSGARGRADECISWMVLNAIEMLAFLETDRRVEAKQMQIED